MFEKSAADKIHNELCLLVSNLKNDYPYNRVYYTKDIYLPAPFLLDTISVCFYSLDDVMPVFDFKALTRSFCVEIILTNSELSPLKIHGGIGSLAITLLFSAGIDNVFEIDGEDIRGDDVRTINDIMILIQTIINSSISQRAAKSNKKSKSSTATEDYLCVV
jgi:hypothetical protein